MMVVRGVLSTVTVVVSSRNNCAYLVYDVVPDCTTIYYNIPCFCLIH